MSIVVQNANSQPESAKVLVKMGRVWCGVTANGDKGNFDYRAGFFPNDYDILGVQGMQQLKDLSYSYTQKYITVISLTVVLWVGEGTSSATLKDGRQVSVPFAETIVFVLKDGKWKVLHAHRSIPNR
jgi:hypothetical protein